MTLLDTTVGFLRLVVHLPTMPVCLGYLLMVGLSRCWQQRTKPLSLRPLMVVHNFCCCLISAVTLAGFGCGLYINGSVYGKVTNHVLKTMFTIYWITKMCELVDTLLMVLRHRGGQVSVLHVYHHASMLLLSDLARSYWPTPSVAVFLAINSGIHVVLYMYYGLTALYPHNPPEWKQQVTQIQILQFLVGLVLSAYGYLHHDFCVWSLVYCFSMVVLFSNFYIKAYRRQMTSHQAVKKIG